MKPVILMRPKLASDGEFESAQKYFNVVQYRADVPVNTFVIPRFSLLPYPDEVHYDLSAKGCVVANSLQEHKWIANFEWYEVLKDHTPRTWTENEFPYIDFNGPFVIKGATNSKKWQWKTHMFAEDRRAAVEVALRLQQDSLVGSQPLRYREYIPLKVHEEAIVGPPFSYEFRFFFWKEQILGASYYWSPAEYSDVPVPNPAIEKAKECAQIVSQYVTFFVLDIAQTANGDWILIEVNDGQQSGLSEISPSEFYKSLTKVLSS